MKNERDRLERKRKRLLSSVLSDTRNGNDSIIRIRVCPFNSKKRQFRLFFFSGRKTTFLLLHLLPYNLARCRF